ncbi:2,4'-dihydroxyacetophenone dioxygenase family protein [Variovorax sp. JS1663]|uniref:2,4'-dihydroxyacetophenone dioxygenase family protein n=1 Tax=Variovorax sp. JS1663 TaxID=1851577 RepID=UPI000B3419C4|nr:2,4'-dihydroxyacetophenone dioxygenase family protein [Variovorax sp. JS1663]
MSRSTARSHPPGLVGFRVPIPRFAAPELVIPEVLPEDERQWVPQSANVWFRPLMLNVTQGYFVNILRVRKTGVLSRHRHDGPVHAHVLKGRWYYLEHEWTATEGSYAHEVPGEVHTLYVPDDVSEMMTLFHVTGAYTYLNGEGMPVGHEDVFTKIEAAAQHYETVGLGEDYVKQFIR